MKIPYKLNPFGKSDGGVDLTKGLDFYLPLEDNWNDVIHGISGTLVNATGTSQVTSYDYKFLNDSSSTIGKMMQCSRGYSKHNIAYFGTEDIFQYGTKDFSFSFWMQASNWGRLTGPLFSKQKPVSGGYDGFVLFRDGANTSKIDMRVQNENNFYTGSNAQSSKWVHWCFIRKNGVGYWYRNGILDATGTCSGNADSSDCIRIGFCPTWNSYNYFIGNLKAYRLYNRALSEKEVTELSNEFDVKYIITASDQTFRFTPVKNVAQTLSYSTIDGLSINCDIVSGSLEGSGIRLYMSAGKWSFYGKAPTDSNHTYNLVVRFSGEELIPKDINVTINTSATSDLSVPSPQTFNFTTEVESSKEISISTEDNADVLSFSFEGQPFPGAGCFVSRLTDTNRIFIETNGRQTSNQSVSKVFDFWTTYHPEHVQATININVSLNQITVADKEINFYTEDGSASQQVKYTSQNAITPVYTLSGTLPTGITFDSSTGTFTYDGITTTPTSGTVQVTVSSSTGCSSPDTGTFTLNLIEGSMPAPVDYSFYAPLQDLNETQAGTGQQILEKSNLSGLLTAQTFKGVPCIYSSASSYAKRWWKYAQTGIAVGTSSRAISVWVNFTNDSNNANCIFAYGQTGGRPSTGSWLRLQKGALDCAFYGCNFTNFSPQLNTWYNYVLNITTNSSNIPIIDLYINGIFMQTVTGSNIMNTSSSGDLYVFGNNWDDGWFSGYISSLRIYNRVLTQEEITALSKEFTPTT